MSVAGKGQGSQERKSEGKETVGILRALGGQVRGAGFSSAIIILTLLYLFIVIFNWMVIALQYCVGFCQTSTQTSHRFIYVPSLLNLTHLPPRPSSLGGYRALVCVSWVNSKFPLAIYFTYGNVYVAMLLSPYIIPSTSSPAPAVSISLFHVSFAALQIGSSALYF